MRYIILPGDMKDLMNRVTEVRKAAEANLIAIASNPLPFGQANTTNPLETNSVLMRQ